MKRDEIWENLRWQGNKSDHLRLTSVGRRDVPPCIAIQKKNLLMELDTVRTLEMLSQDRSRESFWESDFFKDSLVTGEFLEIDYKFFAEAIVGILGMEKFQR
jgi:hypothetical protein